MVIRKPTQQQVKLHRPTERAPDARPLIWSRIDQLCASFTAATGYHLEVVDAEEQSPAAEALWQREIPSCAAAPARLILLKPAGDAARVPLAIAKGLAEPFGETIVELQQALDALWQREGELAAAVPLIVRPREEQTQLANRLAAVLRAGAEAVGGTAAALYLLDDDTRYLKLRSHWGLNHQRLVAPPRPLRGAKADLEALTGHAIVLEDTRPLRHWNIPEDHPAAVCVPVSTATIPLGTLWIFADDPRDFSPPEVNLIEVIAGRLAVELEREILLRSIMHSETGQGFSDALGWQKSAAAHLLPELPGWRWAARTGRTEELHGDFFWLHESSANSVDLTILSAHAGGLAGTLTAALLEGAIRAMLPEASPASRLNNLHQLLQQHSTSDQFASIFCGRVDTAHGHIEMVTAGQTDVFVIRPHGWQPIATARTKAAGTAGPASLATLETQLSVGDMLLAVTGIPRQAPHLYASRQVDARDLAECVLRHNHLAAADIVSALPTLFQPGMSTWQQPPATLLAQRLEAP